MIHVGEVQADVKPECVKRVDYLVNMIQECPGMVEKPEICACILDFVKI